MSRSGRHEGEGQGWRILGRHAGTSIRTSKAASTRSLSSTSAKTRSQASQAASRAGCGCGCELFAGARKMRASRSRRRAEDKLPPPPPQPAAAHTRRRGRGAEQRGRDAGTWGGASGRASDPNTHRMARHGTTKRLATHTPSPGAALVRSLAPHHATSSGKHKARSPLSLVLYLPCFAASWRCVAHGGRCKC